MLEELKKRSLKSVMPGIIILAIIGAVLLAVFSLDFINYVSGPVPFEGLTMGNMEGEYVIVNVNMDYGYFAEEITTTTRNGAVTSRRTSYLYYVIPVGGINRYMGTDIPYEFVGIKIPSKYFDAMDKIDDNSDDFFSTGSLSALSTILQVTGTIKPLDSEMLRYYKEFFEDVGYEGDIFTAYCAPYYIDVESMSMGPEFVVLGAVIIAVVLLLIALYMLISALTGRYQKAMIKSIKANGEMELDRADSDWQSAVELAKNIKSGRYYLFNATSSKTSAYKLSRILWAYTHQTDHKRYGHTMYTTYEIVLYTDDKKRNAILVPGQEACTKILQHIGANSPGTIIGYSDQLRQMFNKNFAEFVRLSQERATQAGQQNNFGQM